MNYVFIAFGFLVSVCTVPFGSYKMEALRRSRSPPRSRSTAATVGEDWEDAVRLQEVEMLFVVREGNEDGSGYDHHAM